jgi:hypothetical protein
MTEYFDITNSIEIVKEEGLQYLKSIEKESIDFF